MGAEADADLTEEKAAAPAAGHKGKITATADRKEAEVVLLKVDQPRNVEGNPNPRDTASMPERCEKQDNIAVDTPDSEDSQMYLVKAPPDKKDPLEKWLQRLAGMIIDVTDNGYCGWYAYLVACTNLHLDLKWPQLELIGKVNETKKQVMNGLITTMADEAKLNPKELDTTLELSGHQDKLTYTLADKLDVLADHYVNQRKCTVRNPVAMSQWVGLAHLKAMARRAREQLFVLGVDSDGAARLHGYAYETVMLARDKTVEIGTAKKMPTDRGATMLEDVVATGVLPLVLVLQNNHFRAVVYDAQLALSSIQWEYEDIAKLASSSLKSIRGRAQRRRTAVPDTTDSVTDEVDDCEMEEESKDEASRLTGLAPRESTDGAPTAGKALSASPEVTIKMKPNSSSRGEGGTAASTDAKRGDGDGDDH
ncbi:hypothetical protein PI124_g20588 [Phytophthora idaei]|nr:hypothetical protein PI125_g21969 [Phytophthora idaei]KAG3234361.1 hypothetical protein PI124_g20588 [Phytophthora idaei]